MSETLKFADGTTVPIIALYHSGEVNFIGASRDQIVVRAAEVGYTACGPESACLRCEENVGPCPYLRPDGQGHRRQAATTQKTQEYDNYVYLHHLNYYYEAGDGAYEYELAFCAKTDAELQNAALKTQLAASLEG